MIKKFFAVIFLAAAVMTTNAQSVFEKGNIGVNAGIGLGWGYGGYAGVSTLAPIPSFNASLEVGTFGIPEVGVISLGGFASFRKTWDHDPYYDYSYSSGIVAARGVFHFGFFDTGGFDLYAGIHTGIRIWNYNYDYLGDDIYDWDYSDNGVDFVHDVFAGARYFMTDNFGFFAEVGYGVSYLKAGVTLKF